MCGIIGAVAAQDVVPLLIDGLKRLEYRGYDSSGVAVINGSLQRIRTVGRVAQLEARVAADGLHGAIGIAHTRWATHGAPSERNAHPHISHGVSVVHNGIIDNHEAIRSRLLQQGYDFTSDTDTEVIAHLIHSHLSGDASLLHAVRQALSELKGAYAIAVIWAQMPSTMVVARHGAPLLLGLGTEATLAASDASALVSITRRIVYLEDGDCAQLSRSDVLICNAEGRPVARPVQLSQLDAQATELGAYRHYMQKEIFEQPRAVAQTLEILAERQSIAPQIFGPNSERILDACDNLLILACGTSYHAALTARYWIEALADIPCQVEIASEYRYRVPASRDNTLAIAVSQSGETADTIAALRYAQERRAMGSLCIGNVAESALMRMADLSFLTRAGPEIGVASTKAFTTQLVALALLALVLAKLRGRLSAEAEGAALTALRRLPEAMEQILGREAQLENWARQLAEKEHALFLGRGTHYPIAMEGALKLKEISYIHAEAHAAGELKHGPLALVNADMPIVAIAPQDGLYDKIKANLQEVSARGGDLYLLTDGSPDDLPGKNERNFRCGQPVGTHGALVSPMLHTLPLQLLAYHTAVIRGNDVDKPRNLAKSVTVE